MRQVLSEVFSSPALIEYGNGADYFNKRRINKLTHMVDSFGKESDFARNLEIFGEGEVADLVYKVLTGAVRAYRVLSDGRRQILDFYYPGDVFGFEASFSYTFSADAVIGSTLSAVKRSQLISLARQDRELAIELWKLMTSDLERARNLSMALGCKSAQEKVIDFLSKIAREEEGGRVAYLPMSRGDVADHLGLTIETISRALTQLECNSDIKFLSSRRILVQKNHFE